jgi:hypothetical protein
MGQLLVEGIDPAGQSYDDRALDDGGEGKDEHGHDSNDAHVGTPRPGFTDGLPALPRKR